MSETTTAKIRINDLARELEVKSSELLKSLPLLGFTEKKTHSSTIDEDLAEHVRRYIRDGILPGAAAAPEEAPIAAVPAAPVPAAPETAPAAAPEEAAPAAPAAATAPVAAAAPAAASEAPTPAEAAPADSAAAAVESAPAPAAKTPTAVSKAAPAKPARPQAPPPAVGLRPAAKPSSPAPGIRPAPLQPGRYTPAATPGLRTAPSSTIAKPAAAQPGRRVIVPVASERPIYKAPDKPVSGKPLVARTQALTPGKPIYQRPAPAGARPSFTPEGRRPQHPTRPGGGRPAAPAGRRHEPRVKEGPLKYQSRGEAAAAAVAANQNIVISEGLTVKDFSERLGMRARDVIRKLFDRGVMATVNQSLDLEVAKQVAAELGAEARIVSFEEQTLQDQEPAGAEAGPQNLRPRAPVVTIMGHVDHGKTSLLDAIRQTNVAGGEAGGITQHIGAYSVEITDPESPAVGRRIVFIDTPGHEAFTRMRARGAKVTDLVVLVVAADDGVMPQTLEAMDHAKAAGVPLIVAVNKIDKPDAVPDRVKKQLADRGLVPEAWGGQTVMVDVSAKAKTNLRLLLEMILLVSDLQDLKADPDQPGQGVVLEAELDRGRGPVAHVLVQTGTLKPGDTVLAGAVMGRVRAMFDDRGRPLTEAGPVTPVEVLGLEGLPEAGDRLVAMQDRIKARQMVEFREQKARDIALARAARHNLESLSQQMASGEVKDLPLILKADVLGSVEVLTDALQKLSNPKVRLVILHSGVGAVTENDVLLASASNAVIVGFSVRPERKATELAEQEKVDIRLHSIIYELMDEMRKAMTGLLEPVFKETVTGRAEVREVFRIPKVGAIAGCLVREGKIHRDAQLRVVRDGAVVYTSRVQSLRHLKEDVTEIKNNMECGIGIANFADVKAGDVLETFTVEKISALALA